MKNLYLLTSLFLVLISCDSKHEKNEIVLFDEDKIIEKSDLMIRPSAVIETANKNHRLIAVYKESLNKKRNTKYIDGNYYYRTYPDYYDDERLNWHGHFMPGLEAIYGNKLLNVSHYNMITKERNLLFQEPTIIKTVYFPSLIQDSIKGKPILRNYYLVSAYDEDTNNDSIINHRDLRKFYYFDIEGQNQTKLIPNGYSVLSSQYDIDNDAMFVYAKHDTNLNGQKEDNEPIHIFWFSLKNPALAERMY